MATGHRISVNRVRELIDYDPDTGTFRAKTARGRWGRIPAGSPVGTVNANGRVRIWLDAYCFNAHRLAWALSHGEWPKDEIDHIDGDPSNNRLSNLRPATRSQNEANKRRLSNNTSGFKGVYWNKQCQKWMAEIIFQKRKIYLGLFDDPYQAHLAYAAKSKALFGEYSRPN